MVCYWPSGQNPLAIWPRPWPIAIWSRRMEDALMTDSHSANSRLDSDADFAVTHPLRPLALAGVMTLLAYGCGVGVVGFVVQPYVPLAVLAIWLVFAVGFCLVWLGLVMVMWRRRPSPRETVMVWGRASRFIAVVSQIVVAWAIWGFFPHLPATETMMLGGMFLICSPAQLIAAPENVKENRFGILASVGSLVLWFTLQGGRTDLAMAVFVAAAGVMFFVLASYVPGTVAETVAARLAADQARADLERALAQVAAERDAKTRFIAAASHDLGQPLQAAGLFFDQTLRTQDDAQRSRAADGVRRALSAAEQLISHMLNHLRLEADAVEPYLATIPVAPLLSRIATQAAPSAAEVGAQVSVVPSRQQLRLDRVLFERALGNLVGNAITHSGASRIVVGVRRCRGKVRVWVIDNGRGIASVDRDRIFDDYYRGTGNSSQAKGGFGLGLSSVRRIAHLMNGKAGLDPNWLNGAAFYLEFPQSPQLGGSI